MKKLIVMLMSFCMACFMQINVHAQQKGEIILTFEDLNATDASFGIYQIATYENGDYHLLDWYDVNLDALDTAEEVEKVMQQCDQIIEDRQIQPNDVLEMKTNTIAFTGLEDGLYYICQESGDDIQCESMLVQVPTFEDGKVLYTVTTFPKYTTVPTTSIPPTPVDTSDSSSVDAYTYLLFVASGVLLIVLSFKIKKMDV